jgi:valyl-tRNA synthetase
MNKSRIYPSVDIAALPKHFEGPVVEARWEQQWREWNVYAYDPSRPRAETFVVDTPPPTVSGSLHIGHVFSYTHADIIVRFKRMSGLNIFYPMGWDDNGLPSERRAQKYFHIRCVANLPYEPCLVLPAANAKTREGPPRELSRKNFVEHCDRLVEEDEKAFLSLWSRTALSVDWAQTYRTNGAHARKLAQYSFADLFSKGMVYTSGAPTMWDVDFQTAVAQAEVEERSVDGAYHRLRFGLEGSEDELMVDTTRPELLAACVGVTAHPDDPRYQQFFGRKCITPLFGAVVPFFPSQAVSPDQGTGAVMVCTFGDATDVMWWRTQNLPLRQVLGREGRFIPVDFNQAPFSSVDASAAGAYYSRLVGKRPAQARQAIVAMLEEPGTGPRGEGTAMDGTPRRISHNVKFYEKGDRPLEFLSSRQWFVSLLPRKEELIRCGEEIHWHPEFMRERFATWTQNLQSDWCISRQRYFGIPIPVWYRLDAEGKPIYDQPIVASTDLLPVDPMIDAAPGFDASQRDQPYGFSADPDVFDTWFTSSITPQINSGWVTDEGRHQRLFPADIRPQGHEIIRTWAFYTISKSLLHAATLPWKHVMVSGWILDPNREKMSKSKGNVVTPGALIEKFSTDAVRYWSARARLGTDALMDESVFSIGKRLTTKIFNAAKLVLSYSADVGPIKHELDLAFCRRLRELVDSVSVAYEAFDYSLGLRKTEEFFWNEFTDTYLEFVKTRARGEHGPALQTSAVAALRLGLSVLVRLFAPVLPYVTEEVWSWSFAGETGQRSVHTAPWPTVREFDEVPEPANAECVFAAAEFYTVFNRYRGDKAMSRKTSVSFARIGGTAAAIRAVEAVMDDLATTLNIGRWEFVVQEDLVDPRFAILMSETQPNLSGDEQS